MSLNKTLTSFTLLGLFVFAMIAFTIQTQENNDVTDTILNDDVFNSTYTNLGTDLDFRSTAQNQSDAQDLDKKTADDGSLIFESITETNTVGKGIIIGVFSTFIKIPAAIGIPGEVVIALTGLLGLILVLLVWRTIKAGE